jgi:regulatory protein
MNELQDEKIINKAGKSTDHLEARKKAMDYLSRREYGFYELVEKVVLYGFLKEAALIAVENLSSEGLQDDKRYVESFVQSRINQGKGPLRIQQELQHRKVSDNLINDAINENTENWFKLAEKVRLKKFGSKIPLDFQKNAKEMKFLKYRGFESDHIQYAMKNR